MLLNNEMVLCILVFSTWSVIESRKRKKWNTEKFKNINASRIMYIVRIILYVQYCMAYAIAKLAFKNFAE